MSTHASASGNYCSSPSANLIGKHNQTFFSTKFYYLLLVGDRQYLQQSLQMLSFSSILGNLLDIFLFYPMHSHLWYCKVHKYLFACLSRRISGIYDHHSPNSQTCDACLLQAPLYFEDLKPPITVLTKIVWYLQTKFSNLVISCM